MAKTEYSELLRNPKWQKRRLEIMNKDGFCCMLCYDDGRPLNVHHLIYFKGNNPWEYDDKHLITLCESCHSEQRDFDLDKALADLTISKTAIIPLIALLKQVIPFYVSNERASAQAITSFCIDNLQDMCLDRDKFIKDTQSLRNV